MTREEDDRKRRIRVTTIALALIALGFYAAFIMMGVTRA